MDVEDKNTFRGSYFPLWNEEGYHEREQALINRDEEFIIDILGRGKEFNKPDYEIAREILREFKRKEKPKRLFSDEELNELRLVVEENDVNEKDGNKI